MPDDFYLITQLFYVIISQKIFNLLTIICPHIFQYALKSKNL